MLWIWQNGKVDWALKNSFNSNIQPLWLTQLLKPISRVKHLIFYTTARAVILQSAAFVLHWRWKWAIINLFQFVGIILIAIGLLVELHRQQLQSMNDQLALPVALLILVGFIIVINALCGLVGTFTENVFLLKVVSVMLVNLFLFAWFVYYIFMRYLNFYSSLGLHEMLDIQSITWVVRFTYFDET